jgi:DNA polymerase-3 subunit alpha
MSDYIPLHVHSHYSLQLGLSKPESILDRCKQIGASTCALTDINSISGSISFLKAASKYNIKPIIGCEINIVGGGRLVLLAQNISGWQNLIKIISLSHNKELYNNQPQITLEHIKEFADNIICIDGFHESCLWSKITDNDQLKFDYKDIFNQHIANLTSIFKDKYYIEIQLFDTSNNKIETCNSIRQLCKDSNIPRIAGINAYYVKQEDSVDQKILLCSKLKTTLPEVSKKIIQNTNTGFNHFFNCDQFYILDNNVMKSLYDDVELKNTQHIAEICEHYSPLQKPTLPVFSCPSDFKSPSEYLRQLCRNGWKQKIDKIIPKDQQQLYVDRIKKELDILDGAGLSSYFLIVRDIIEYIRTNNWLPGPGRGSAAGCLVSYLIGITSIDPIKYNLLFERFYNAGRNTKDRISMPDIDVDVPIEHRDDIIRYIKNKYGFDKVSQMITYNTLKGRGALKEVLRVYGNISFDEMNNITKHIPDEAKIADELQELKDEDGSASIIMWALENNSEKLKEWCYIDENNQLSGPLAKRFEQAIRIEGTKYNQSKHAAGIAIAANRLDDICPMIYDNKTQQNIAGLEMSDLEALGIVKFDILGIALLDKMMSVNSYIQK